jgi:hypothetical protein
MIVFTTNEGRAWALTSSKNLINVQMFENNTTYLNNKTIIMYNFVNLPYS